MMAELILDGAARTIEIALLGRPAGRRGDKGDIPMSHARLSMPLGEAMFTQRAIRRFRPDPIPTEDIRLCLEAASKAPNGGNRQIARFLVVTDRALIQAFGRLYHEAWWAKRWAEHRWTKPEDIPPEERTYRSAMGLADRMQDVPCLVLALAVPPGAAHSVLPAVQNLMLAARALGIGSVPTTLHPSVMERVYALFGLPRELTFHFCVPLGYPEGRFGPTTRRPAGETTWWNRWGAPVPWTSPSAGAPTAPSEASPRS
jgi:nitroreductase